ncbi:centromere protein Chl4/mis15/CENP-N [Xylariomycetidae sp. FL0641]|nr:centromere protein Chl4/mis15/CENP-N [Xylariomycetidae sp. FL0641]
MARLSLPTTARLPSSLRVNPTNPAVVKVLNRLSRASLLSLVLDWLNAENQSLCPPLLRRRASSSSSEDDDDDDDDDELYADDLYPPARSLEALQTLYADLQTRKGSRREVVDRIVEGDWRQGLSLYQLAMADLQYLYDHPGTMKWAAYRIARLKTTGAYDDNDDESKTQRLDRESLKVPRFHPSTFLQNLQAAVLPDVKAHYVFDRPAGKALLLLRICVLDSPYNTDLSLSQHFASARTVYVAFPDASPHIFVSKAQGGGGSGGAGASETRSLRALLVHGVPKALSRPRERFALRPTNLQTKNLDALLAAKGPGRTNAAQGGWSLYAAAKHKDARNDSPLNVVLPSPPLSDETEDRGDEDNESKEKAPKRLRLRDPADLAEEKKRKRARMVAQARFADSARVDDGKGVERLDILMEDAYPDSLPSEDDDDEDDQPAPDARRSNKGRKSNADASLLGAAEVDDGGSDVEARRTDAEDRQWKPNIRLTFHGSHVFGGIRQLVEAGIIDGERMPGWMTGEEGVTVGAVRHGRIRGHKGSGL